MSERNKDSENSIFPKDEIPSLPGDPTPEQLKAAGFAEMPKGKEEIKEECMRLTQNFKQVFYWTPKPQTWFDRKLGGHEPPYGVRPGTRELVQCRPYEEVALVIHEPALWEQGLVKLRYDDKVEVVLEVENLHYGLRMTGNEVRRKFVPCRPGERDVMGVLHKGG